MNKQDVVKWCKDNDYELIKKTFDIVPLTEREIIREGISGILSRVSKLSGITQAQLLEPSKKEKYMFPRQLAQAIASKYLIDSHAEIASRLGGVHRTVVIGSAKAVRRLIDTDKYYRYKYEDIIELYSMR